MGLNGRGEWKGEGRRERAETRKNQREHRTHSMAPRYEVRGTSVSSSIRVHILAHISSSRYWEKGKEKRRGRLLGSDLSPYFRPTTMIHALNPDATAPTEQGPQDAANQSMMTSLRSEATRENMPACTSYVFRHMWPRRKTREECLYCGCSGNRFFLWRSLWSGHPTGIYAPIPTHMEAISPMADLCESSHQPEDACHGTPPTHCSWANAGKCLHGRIPWHQSLKPYVTINHQD